MAQLPPLEKIGQYAYEWYSSTQSTQLCQKFDDPVDPPSKIWRPQNINISARFWTTSRLNGEYFHNATRFRNSENSVAIFVCC